MVNPLDVNQLRVRIQNTLTEFIAEHRKVMEGISSETTQLVDSLAELMTGGKRLRPAFAYWGYLAGHGNSNSKADDEAVVRACAALEFLQACAIIHDDVMDNSDTRRGLPAVHKQFESMHSQNSWASDAQRFGAGAAILIGDLALAWADELIFTSGLTADQISRANEIYHVMRTELMAGQYLDLLEQVRGEITQERSAIVIRFKSAKYTIERPLLMGAAIANSSAEVSDALSRYGLALGEAFQLRDDLLGVFGDEQVTGKPAGDDLREGKQTMLIAYARELATPAQLVLIEYTLGNPELTPNAVAAAQQALIDCGAEAKTEARISEQLENALEAISELSDEVRTALTDLAVMATKRSS